MSVRRERSDAREHHCLILETAQRLFSKHGVHTVSMHQIAKTAGIGQGTLYRRYAHKGDLCLDILQEYSRVMKEQISAFLDRNRDLPASERLGGLIDRFIDALEEKSELISVLETKSDHNDPRGNFFHSPMYLFFRDKIGGLLAEIAAAGVSVGPGPDSGADSPFDAELAAHAVICSMSPIGYFHLKHEKKYTAAQMKAVYRRMYKLAEPDAAVAADAADAAGPTCPA